MSCDCIKRLEGVLTEKMKEAYPNGEVKEPVEFQNKSLVFGADGKTKVILSNQSLGKVAVGKTIKKYTVSILPKYCPYCGKPLKEEGGSNE